MSTFSDIKRRADRGFTSDLDTDTMIAFIARIVVMYETKSPFDFVRSVGPFIEDFAKEPHVHRFKVVCECGHDLPVT